MQDDLTYRPATAVDVAAVVALVNGAYRGDASRDGWTTEADLLDGTRTDAEEVAGLIADPDSLLLLCERAGTLLGTAHLRRHGDTSHLGMFTVRPGWQGRGIGSTFLAVAEASAQRHFGAHRLWMAVITLREELIAFYERRGYRRTGRFEPFPDHIRYGVPKVDGLRLAVLEKAFDRSG